MTATRIDHVAVAVYDIDTAAQWFVSQMDMTRGQEADLPDQGVKLSYLELGGTTLQLLQPLGESQLRHYLDEHGEGLHHICFEVPDLGQALADIPGEGRCPVWVGGKGALVTFIGQRPSGVLLELTEGAGSTNRSIGPAFEI